MSGDELHEIIFGRFKGVNQEEPNRSSSTVEHPSQVPVFADCAWYGGNPFDLESKLPNGLPAPSRDWNQTNPKQWAYDMARFCLDRHHRAINASFVDGSARGVKLKSLWDLQWHRTFRRTNNVPLNW